MDLMKRLINQLKILKKLGASGVKQSLEDEGVSFQDIEIMRVLTKKIKMKLNVKIGGCEAKNDIFFCSNLKVDSIVAPMVESSYALKKFIQVVPKEYLGNLFINLESKTAFNNINRIINSENFKKLKGVVIGRSDLAGSYGMSKSQVNSKKIYREVHSVLKNVKKKGKITKMGGSITVNSKNFIKNLYEEKLINNIEARNLELKLSNRNISNLDKIIPEIFEFEILWLKFRNTRKDINIFKKKDNSKRILIMKKRLEN